MPGSALRQRAAAAAGREVERQDDRSAEVAPVKVQIRQMETEFRKAMPAGEAVQFVRDAITCLQTVRDLDKCEPRSVLGSLMTCAQLGLRPAVLGHAWPLPYWDKHLAVVDPRTGRTRKGGHRAQLIIGYQGFTHLAYESGKVSAVRASVVYEEDHFDWDEGSNEPPEHRRPRLGRPRGEVIGYYAVVQTVLGGNLVHVMDVPEILAFRDQFAPRRKVTREGSTEAEMVVTGPWAKPVGSTEFNGMAQKTCLRYALKTAPKSAQLARAEAVDGTVRVDTSVLTEAATVSEHPTQTPAEGIVLPRDEAEERDPAAEVDPTLDPDWGRDQS